MLRSAWRRLALCLAVGAVASMGFGTDANWDLQNYHLYAPFALLHGRLGLDYFAGGFQGYFNPLADLPYYLLRRVVLPSHPVLVAGLAGLPYGAMAFLVIGIAEALLPGEEGRLSWSALFAAGIGLSGATLVSEIGTSFGDIVSGDALLLGVFLALRRPARWPAAALGAGLGAATALKLTAVIFAPGLALWLLTLTANRRGQWRQAGRSLLAFGAACACAFMLLWGWWGWTLWRHFHNPFFPLLGQMFASPWSFPVDAHDPRFFPRDVWQWLFYPFFWLQGRAFIATEGHLRDPRFALAYLALLAAAWRAASPRNGAGRTRAPAAVLGLWLFAATSYLCWLVGFSILRYAVPLEALTGVVLATALRYVRPAWATPQVIGLLLLACFAATRPMGWGRIGYGRHLVEAPLPVLPARAMVFIVGAPLGFVVPSLATPGRQFVRLDFLVAHSPELAAVRAAIAREKLFVLTDFPDDPAGAAGIATALAPVGLLAAAGCQPVHIPVGPPVRLCPVMPAR